ncbi:MAG: aspartyl aminopeptidase, partial [Arenicella sp.]
MPSSHTLSPIVQDLLDFIDESPSPFHATQNLVSMFCDA